MRYAVLFFSVLLISLSSCRDARIHEHDDWGKYYEEYGIKKACFMLRDHNHEAIDFYNKERCLERMSPASTFKIFNSLVALETAKAPDDQFLIPWDGVQRKPEWDKDLTLRDAFRESAVWYFQEMARRIGQPTLQHYLDTVQYGNKTISRVDTFWLDNSLQISADEQVGFLKRMYFNELPFSERTQRIVKSMMLWEDSTDYKLYYKTGWSVQPDKETLWVVGFAERVEKVKEAKESMNKSDSRSYPYFFAQNFEIAKGDTSRDWKQVRIDILKKVLRDFGAI